jgi:hypothetical protein
MTWRWAAASVAGTSHSVTDQPCQDACCVRLLSGNDGDHVLGIFVADGAGSARHGGEGAVAAVQAAAVFWAERLSFPDSSVDASSMGLCVVAIRARLASLAVDLGVPVRECACTFVSVLASSRDVVTFQVGDGGIVLDLGHGYLVATKPMSGEYANTTLFITESEDRISAGETIWHGAPAKRISVFTDGLQRLALDHTLTEANPRFFDRRFATLEAASPDQEDQIEPALAAFLACDAINRHTDDDKTLVLASLMSE